MSTLLVGLALVLVLANGVFVAAEFSMVASQRAKLELLGGTSRRATAALAVMRDLPRHLAGSQLGVTVCSLGLGVLGEPAVADLVRPGLDQIGVLSSGVAHGIAFAIALAIVVTLHMVLGEMVPKGVALAGPERTLLVLAPVSRGFTALFGPLIWFLDRCSSLLVRAFGLTPKHELAGAVTAAELGPMIDASRDEGLLETFEHALLASALDFRARPVSAVMVPREEVVYVNRRMSVAAIERVANRTGHSRLPVVGSGIDDVVGFLHIKDLLSLPAEARDLPLPAALVRRMQILPHDRPLEDVLRSMRRARSHLAVVRGAGGRTAGVVTLEDVLEAFVGDMRDETDRDPTP